MTATAATDDKPVIEQSASRGNGNKNVNESTSGYSRPSVEQQAPRVNSSSMCVEGIPTP